MRKLFIGDAKDLMLIPLPIPDYWCERIVKGEKFGQTERFFYIYSDNRVSGKKIVAIAETLEEAIRYIKTTLKCLGLEVGGR